MNKQQIEYLKSKITAQAASAKHNFAKDKVVAHGNEYVANALMQAGFIPAGAGTRSDMKYVAGYITLPPTEEMKANKAAIEAFNEKVDDLKSRAIDAAYLGDNSDALKILADFTEATKAL